MKMKYTLAALAATTLVSNAALIQMHNLSGSVNNQAGLTASSGFSFTTTALGTNNELASIEVGGPTSGAAATVFGIEIYENTGGDAATFTLGALFATSTSTSVIANGTVNTFLFDGPELLADNTSYIAVFTDGAGTAIGSRIGLVNGATDAGTTTFSNGASVFGGSHEAAITVNAVPEPSSTALLGLGGLALILRRRK